MANYFGTDGVRGEYGKNLTTDLAFSVGNALSQIKTKPKVLIGHDTRVSADALKLAVSLGIVQGGGTVVDVGIIPTAGVSFLTKTEHCDYGVVITASHNPPNCNGIKVFGADGKKISDTDEEFLEEFFKNTYTCQRCGKFIKKDSLKNKYINHLKNCTSISFENMHICLDASNGASFSVAPKVFRAKKANIECFSCKNNGAKINIDCGSLNPQILQKHVLKTKAEVGFAFDGDADRVIAVSKSGKIFDGDKLLYILATHLKEKGELYANSVVGTSHTNSGIMVALNKHKINLIRTDIGDKYVIEAMEKMNLVLGGEQSGHIIIKAHSQTGDGILTALKICEIMKETRKTLDQLFDAKLIPQVNANMPVKDKIKVINNEELKNLISDISNKIAPAGRILVRASGTEEKVRIMVEYTDEKKAQEYLCQIQNKIETI